jgi:hypothetical protein
MDNRPETAAATSSRVLRASLVALMVGGALLTDACSASRATRQLAPAPLGKRDRPPFISFNVPNLHYIEDVGRFDTLERQRLPDPYEIRDALETIRLMGGTVVRIYVLSVRKGTDPVDVVRHVMAPRQFNEAAFVSLDRVMATAAELGLQVILPFVDNWRHWGGVTEYAAMRGKPRDAFFTDEELVEDFEATMDKVLLRTNTINGRAYRDDAAVFAWETGNELMRPDAWAARITGYIKQRDAKHAVIDGTYGPTIREASLIDPNVDIVSSHHYGSARRNLELISDNVRKIHGRKRYFIGEFGMWRAPDTERLLRLVLEQPIEGALIWGLRGHDRDGGFYHHMERAPFESYHFPGFASGAAYDERLHIDLMRSLAFGARNLPVPPIPAPPPPAVIGVTAQGAVSFRGSLGARDYTIERQSAPEGAWEVVAEHFDETRIAYRPFVDPAPPIGQKVRYRVVASNETGRSEPSAPSDPITIDGRLYVDEMDSPATDRRIDSNLTVTNDHPERCKMDRSRLKGAPGSRAVYRLDERATGLRIFVCAARPGQVLDVAWSADGGELAKLPTVEDSFNVPGDDPVNLRPVRVTAGALPPSARQLAITWLVPAEVGRVEIAWATAP